MRASPFVAAICVVALALLAPPAARADDKDKLQGTWKVTFVAVTGETVPDALRKKMSVKFEGDDVTLVYPDGQSETIRFTLKADTSPHSIINFGERSGFVKKGKRKTDATLYLGIYKFEGPDRLKLCWGPIGEPRPLHFNARRSRGHRYFILGK
jgi:uncharacterized protein (TIGR03067 family)